MANPNIAFESGGNLPTNFARAMEKLGGFKTLLKVNQPAVVAISMPFPEPSPVTTSFALLEVTLKELKSLNLPKVQVCAVPDWGFEAKDVAQVLGIGDFVRQLGAEFISITRIAVSSAGSNVKYALFPLISNAPNYIALPTVRFDPFLGFIGASGVNLQFLRNARKWLSGNRGVCEKNPDELHEKFVDVILGSLSSRVPDLTIIDGSHILVGQGPLLLTGGQSYSDNFLLAGNNPLALDTYLAEILGFKKDATLLLQKITHGGFLDSEIQRNIGKISPNTSGISAIPPKANSNFTSHLPPRMTIGLGKTCVLCQRTLRFLTDFLCEIGEKDLTYLEEINFLAGIAPSLPPSFRNICLLGDCVINSTKKYEFHLIKQVKVTEKGKEKEPKKGKEKEPKKGKEKVSFKRNKTIIKIPGCPPSPLEVLRGLLRHFSGKNMPAISFWLQVWKGLQSKPSTALPKVWHGDEKK